MSVKQSIVFTAKVALLLAAKYLHVFNFLPKKLRILMYHGAGCSDFPVESFDRQMQFISKHFDTYWVSEASEVLDGTLAGLGKKPPMILTFDDGLLNNKLYAAPILEKYGLKATFFVCSDLMDGNSMLWNHELRCRLQLITQEEIIVATNGECTSISYPAIFEYVEKVKRWPQERVQGLLSLLRTDSPFPEYTESMMRDYLLMSTQDMHELPDCIEIGSHTRNHPLLDVLDEAEIDDQVVASKQKLAQVTGKTIDTFCYPNGATNDYCNSIVEKTYKVAVTTEEGFAEQGDELTLLKRIPASENMHDMVWRFVRPTG